MSSHSNAGLGYGGAMIAIVCFGTYAVPTKFFKTGDGMMFQWIQCAAIWMFGLMIQFCMGFYEFQPLAVLGGVLWCLGNATVIPIIGWIGLSLGMLVWGLIGMLIGWSSGHFGWFGIPPDPIAHPPLNIAGVVLASCSIALYLPIKSSVKDAPAPEPINYDEKSPLFHNRDLEPKKPVNPLVAKVMGLSASVLAGLLYGFNMIPVTYLQHQALVQHGIHRNGLDYCFSHFTGIFMCSTTLVLLYCIFKKNKPWFNNEMVLPAMGSGVLWAAAQSAWFVANTNLGMSVAFPMISTGPGVVASSIGVLVFKEIQGVKNIAFLLSAFTFTLVGVILIALSKG